MEILAYKALTKLNSANYISLITNKKMSNWKKPHKTTFLQTQQGLGETLRFR